jgi:hypothetical protein
MLVPNINTKFGREYFKKVAPRRSCDDGKLNRDVYKYFEIHVRDAQRERLMGALTWLGTKYCLDNFGDFTEESKTQIGNESIIDINYVYSSRIQRQRPSVNEEIAEI